MDYLTWNDAIGARFFKPARGGERVFLYVTTDVIEEIGEVSGAGLDDFIAAVKVGPPWNTHQRESICKQALHTHYDWRGRNLQYPPYLGYLALFVMADTVDVGFARHAYYPGLRSLLGEEPETGTYPYFDRMHLLWGDLAIWSNQDKQGEWGIFEADVVGGWMHVGIPRSQTLLTDRERGNLPLVFANNGLDPNSLPTDRELAFLLADDPERYLRPITKEILSQNRAGDSSLRAALIDLLLDELENWDGQVPVRQNGSEQASISLGNLRLIMVLDRIAQTARFSLRCKSNREYPDEGLKLIGDSLHEPLFCRYDWQGWSTQLSNDETQTSIFDSSQFDWGGGLVLNDAEHAWKTTLTGRSIRVMVSAAPFGFDGFVEQNQIPQGKQFYLLAHNIHASLLEKWGTMCCEGFYEVDLTSSLPLGWRLFSIKNANSDDFLREAFPSLAFPTHLRVQFRGGIKVSRNKYFSFALPRIEVIGASNGSDVFCNDLKLELASDSDTYAIPDELRASRLVIEVRRKDVCICRRSLYAFDSAEWRDVQPTTFLDKYGLSTDEEKTDYLVGPLIKGFTPPSYTHEVFLPPSEGMPVYFVGRKPGEIIKCPEELISGDWQPVWAIQKQNRRKLIVIYCGSDPETDGPMECICSDNRKLSLWQKVLWYWRRRITEPTHPKLLPLWRKYQQVAKNVR